MLTVRERVRHRTQQALTVQACLRVPTPARVRAFLRPGTGALLVQHFRSTRCQEALQLERA